jgi:hypothetical protein
MRFKEFWSSFEVKKAYRIRQFKTHRPRLFNTDLNVKFEILFNSDTLSEELLELDQDGILPFYFGIVNKVHELPYLYEEGTFIVSLLCKIVKVDLYQGLTITKCMSFNEHSSILIVMLSELNCDSVLFYLYDEEALYFTGHENDIIMLHNVKLRNANRHIYLDYISCSAYFINNWSVGMPPEKYEKLIDFDYPRSRTDRNTAVDLNITN